MRKGKIRISLFLILPRRTTRPAAHRRLVARRDLVAGVAGVEGLGGGVGRPGVVALEPARRAGELGDLFDHAGRVAGDDGAGRDVACDDGPGTNKRALADGDARENGGVGADARQAAQLNR